MQRTENEINVAFELFCEQLRDYHDTVQSKFYDCVFQTRCTLNCFILSVDFTYRRVIKTLPSFRFCIVNSSKRIFVSDEEKMAEKMRS